MNLLIKLEILYNQGVFILKSEDSVKVKLYRSAIKKFGYYIQQNYLDDAIIEKGVELQQITIKCKPDGLIGRYFFRYAKYKGLIDSNDEQQYIKTILNKLDSLKFRILNKEMFD